MAFPTFISSLFIQTENVNTVTFIANQALITGFLQASQNVTIRVYVDNSPGYGHQSNTVNIICSLITMGFNQTIQLIYNEDTLPNEQPTIVKLSKLIPDLNPLNPIPVMLNGVPISFIALSVFNSQPQPLFNFGITGGYDSESENLAKKTNTTIFLKLQPYCWPAVNALYIRDAIEQSTVSVDLSQVSVLGDYVFTRQNYYLPIPDMTHADYIAFQNSDPTKVKPYSDIIVVCSGVNPKANLMPVYGIGDTNGKVVTLSNVPAECVLFNLIASIAYTQDYSNVVKLKKGAIMTVIATVTDLCYENLMDILTGKNNLYLQITDYAKAHKLAERVSIIEFNDPQFDKFLKEVSERPDKILIVKMNGLPVKPFNYIYSKSTLPCVFEGKGTASLVLNLPVPFFNLTSSQLAQKMVYPTINPIQNIRLVKEKETNPNPQALECNKTVYRLIEQFSITNNKFVSEGMKATAFYAIGQLIWKLNMTEDPINQYIASLPVYFHNQENDKLLQAMSYMLKCTKDLN
jgi:hypothetical protein